MMSSQTLVGRLLLELLCTMLGSLPVQCPSGIIRPALLALYKAPCRSTSLRLFRGISAVLTCIVLQIVKYPMTTLLLLITALNL